MKIKLANLHICSDKMLKVIDYLKGVNANIILHNDYANDDECESCLKRMFMAEHYVFEFENVDGFLEVVNCMYIGIHNWNVKKLWSDMLTYFPMFIEDYYLKTSGFEDTYLMVVQYLVENIFEIEEAYLIIGYVTSQCLGLFCLMVCVRICEIMVWHYELDHYDKNIDVVWLNIVDD